jgi:hypothetical protein
LKAGRDKGDKGDKEDKGEKADFSLVLIVSTHLWIKNLHLSEEAEGFKNQILVFNYVDLVIEMNRLRKREQMAIHTEYISWQPNPLREH